MRLYMAEVLRARLFGAIRVAAEYRKNVEGLTRKDVADRMGRDEATVSRTFSAPANWTIKTISDLCYSLNLDMQFVLIDRLDKDRVFVDTGMHFKRIHQGQRLVGDNKPELTNYIHGTAPRRPVKIMTHDHRWPMPSYNSTAAVENYPLRADGKKHEHR
ncbi:hypothetical protein MKK69_16465 [Methylobacterium sp. J-026]|uniref:helix-turn-helix domain-containing protein n=1 Tax=Methylobacterium sp. J-026 TaxID=2836624 RepID=UPI001FBC0419|nr:hypothetical protein [Methylobacterium sp. J-026]MCJ2135626.1 hypothetical protein [Methylobacterium sp. J-026]